MRSDRRINGQAIAALALLLTGVICNASVIPYMGVYIVETLGKDPWMISPYVGITLTLTLLVNRQYGEWIDAGVAIAPLILCSIAAFGLAVTSILVVPNYTLLVFFASPCFAISNASVSTMYSFGRLLAEREGLDVPRYNSYLRAMTSLGWMLAPAGSFYIASVADAPAVFGFALGLCFLWGGLWWIAMPKQFAGSGESSEPLEVSGKKPQNFELWFAAGICLAFALAHTMTMSALPLFYIREAGLPTYAAGVSFSIKTAVEIAAILLAPRIMSYLGARNALRLAALLAIGAFVVLSQVTTMAHLWIGAAMEGLYYGLFAAVGLTYLQDFSKGRIARATSLYMNSLFLGGLLANLLMGFVAQFFSFGLVIQLSIFWAVLAFAMLSYMRPNVR